MPVCRIRIHSTQWIVQNMFVKNPFICWIYVRGKLNISIWRISWVWMRRMCPCVFRSMISQANLESSLYNLHADLRAFQSELLDQTNPLVFPNLHQNLTKRSKELSNRINITTNELFYLSILVPTRVNLSFTRLSKHLFFHSSIKNVPLLLSRSRPIWSVTEWMLNFVCHRISNCSFARSSILSSVHSIIRFIYFNPKWTSKPNNFPSIVIPCRIFIVNTFEISSVFFPRVNNHLINNYKLVSTNH